MTVHFRAKEGTFRKTTANDVPAVASDRLNDSRPGFVSNSMPFDIELATLRVPVRRRLCFVGHMLGRNLGHITTQGQVIADLFATEGFEVTSVSSRLNRAVRLSEIVFTLIRGFRSYDVVVLETFSGLSFVMAEVVSRLCRLLNLPLVMFLHGGNLPVFAREHPRWVRSVFRRADKLAAPSEFIAVRFRDMSYEVTVIPNAIEIDGYPVNERKEVRPKLIWMRSFHDLYNPEMAVRVLAGLKRSHPEATLTMAGADKGGRPAVEELAAEMGLSDSIRFVGFLDRKGKLEEFAKADIYINTNRVDNMPVSVIEARALGLPVVATEVGGLPYIIRNRENGLLVPDNDVEAMVSAIVELVADPDLSNRISRRGREIAEASDWNNVRVKWENLLSEVLDSKRRHQNPSPATHR